MNYNYSLILLLSMGYTMAYDLDHVKEIKQEVLSGQNFSEPQPESAIVEVGVMENLKKLFKPYTSSFKALPKFDALKRVWDELPSQTPDCAAVVDRMTIHELSLVRGENGSNLVDSITDPTTNGFSAISQKQCAEMLSMPHISLEQLSSRREIIRALNQDQMLLSEVKSLLKTLKDSEPYVLDFYGKDGVSQHEEAVYPGIVLKALSIAESPSAITASNRAWIFGVSPAIGVLIGGLIGAYSNGVPINKDFLYYLMKASGTFTYELYKTKPMLILMGAMTPLYAANMGLVKSVSNAIKDMQERAIGVATYVRTAKKLLTLLNNNPELTALMPSLKNQLDKLEGSDATASEKFTYLNDMLQHASTFDAGEPSALSSPGNTLLAYKYLCDKNIRAEYASVMNMIGEIDVYTCLADKMSANDNTKAPFCFVEFVEESDKPVLEVQDFWHPLIDAEQAVSNSVSLNTNNERNMIITGPNTGGKSTTMKALASSVILAQTFGIAPATSMRITPFSAICSYLNVSDDISAGLSLFKAEVKRFQDLMKTTKNLPAGAFAFVILDEIFTGTSPDKAEELSYNGFKKLGELEHVIFLAATHFKKNTELEQVTDGTTKNYQMEAITDANDMVVQYTYKLVPGASKINSAQQVLDESSIEL